MYVRISDIDGQGIPCDFCDNQAIVQLACDDTSYDVCYCHIADAVVALLAARRKENP